MLKSIFAAAIVALLAGPALAQSSDQGAPSGANTSKAQGFQGAQPPARGMHHRWQRHHWSRGGHHHRHHARPRHHRYQ